MHAAVLPATTASRGRERSRSNVVSLGRSESHAALTEACVVSAWHVDIIHLYVCKIDKEE